MSAGVPRPRHGDGDGDRSAEVPRIAGVLGEYETANPARFHMPGHKGRGMAGFWRQGLVRWDVTELTKTDNLHAPSGMLARAQAECAALYGAEDSFFLVNGSTAGLLAMLLALGEGAEVLLSRDCHKSALSGAVLGGLRCRFLLPDYEDDWGMWGMVTPKTLDRALRESPAAAALIPSPNYYGLCADLPGLARVAHSHGAMLLIDGAHGAHFPFGKTELPPSPAGYADLWVNSAHKTLNALGQAALLHRGRGCPIPAWRLQQALRLVETTSPSYLLMASLDWAMYSAAMRQTWDAQALLCRDWGARMGRLPGLRALDEAVAGRAGVCHKDPTRLVMDVTERGITGFQAAAALEQANVFVEMADARRLVCICTPADDPEWYPRLYQALQSMPYGRKEPPPQPRAFAPPDERLPLRKAALSPAAYVPLSQAAGRIAAEAAGLYPPGIALWVPGEEISPGAIAQLQQQQAMGGAFFGIRDGCALVVA